MTNQVSIVNEPHKTRAWCRKSEFSGIRQDPILQNCEIWVMGKMVKEVSKEAMQLTDGKALVTAYEDAFGLPEGSVTLT